MVYLEDWYSSSLSTKITAKCFKDLNVEPETLKLSEEKLGKTVKVEADILNGTRALNEIIPTDKWTHQDRLDMKYFL